MESTRPIGQGGGVRGRSPPYPRSVAEHSADCAPSPPAPEAEAEAEAELSLPEWVVLAVIAERPTHGFAIAALTATDGPIGRVWQIPRPVIYRGMGRLADADLIITDVVEPGKGPQRTRYRITALGRGAVAHWLTMPVEHVRDLRSHLLVKLALLDRLGESPTVLLDRQRARLEPIIDALTRAEPEDDFDRILLAWRRASAAAAVAFLDDIAPH
jgi:DNA-binding PadR family transcriptional regulator